MLGPNLKSAASRAAGFVAKQRPFSSTIVARTTPMMEDLLLDIPPELRIGGVNEKKIKQRGPKREDERLPGRRETVSFGRAAGTPSPKRSSERLYRSDGGASSGFGSLMGKQRSVPGSSESYPFAESQTRGRDGQRGPRDDNKRTSKGPRDDNRRSAPTSQRQSQPRERTTVESSGPSTPAPRVQQLRPQDYAPVRPRGQEDLFGTTSLLDIDVAEMDQSEGNNAEFAGADEAISTHQNTALHRALLSVGGYAHLVPEPLASSPSGNAVLDPKTNKETLHRFAAHHADFSLTRGVNVGEGQRGVARGVIMGRLGVKS